MTIRILSLLSLCVLLYGCGGSGSSTDVIEPPIDRPGESGKVDPEKVRLHPGLSCAQYTDYISRSISENLLFVPPYYELTIEDPAADVAFSNIDVSDTNIQEAGVDEADIIKAASDGTFYIADQHRVVVANSFPATELSIRSTIQFDDDRYIQGLLLDEQNQRLIVSFYADYQYIRALPDVSPDIISPIQATGSTLKFIDIANPDLPVEIKEVKLSGFIQEMRYVDEKLLLIMHNDVVESYNYSTYFNDDTLYTLSVNYRDAVEAGDDQNALLFETQLRSEVAARVALFDIREFLPSILEYDDNGASTPTNALGCNDIYAPELEVFPSLQTIYRFSHDGELLAGIAALISQSYAYVSDDQIYFYQSSANWWLTGDRIDESAIHQFSYDDETLNYVAMGVIPGTINNRFSMSELNGNLRVASSSIEYKESTPQFITRRNHLHVLQPDDNQNLNIIGNTPNYADDEQIFSARFIEERAYVVTFRNIDPLFSFDLSDPANPALMGELEIPGFSEYIHPVGQDRLITIGRNGNDAGLIEGVKFQLFDVSDLQNPTLLHDYVPTRPDGTTSYSWSAASYEPHAFTYIDDKELLVVPMEMFDSTSIDENLAGFIVLHVSDADGFTELGRIDHDDFISASDCAMSGASSLDDCIGGFGPYWVEPRRSVVITDNDNDQSFIYSLSNIGVKASSAEDPGTTLSSINFLSD